MSVFLNLLNLDKSCWIPLVNSRFPSKSQRFSNHPALHFLVLQICEFQLKILCIDLFHLLINLYSTMEKCKKLATLEHWFFSAVVVWWLECYDFSTWGELASYSSYFWRYVPLDQIQLTILHPNILEKLTFLYICMQIANWDRLYSISNRSIFNDLK